MTCDPRDPTRHPVDSSHEKDACSFLGNPPIRIFSVDELIQLVAQRTGISAAQATLAVAAMLSYLTARLPSSVVGRIHEQLGAAQPPPNSDGGQGGGK